VFLFEFKRIFILYSKNIDNLFNLIMKDEKKENNTRNNTLVAVRCRPINSRESTFSNIETIQIRGRDIVTVIDPIEYDGVLNNKTRTKEQNYAFDIAFTKNSTQEEVYISTTKFLIKDVIEGYNATVFAYGASGAGKTYTMVGINDQPGIMVRTVSDLFNEIKSLENKDYRIKINYIEIYNETLRDLLSENNDTLELREDPAKGVSIVGVSDVAVASATEVFRLLM
jgi:kinesin family protein 18/19